MHQTQVDGCDSISDDLDEDDNYLKTSQYWKEGKLGTVFQTYLDVLEIIEKSELTEESKDVERAKVLEARKDAFGKTLNLLLLGLQSDNSHSINFQQFSQGSHVLQRVNM